MINKQLMLNQYNKKHSTTYPTMKNLLTALYSQCSGIRECAEHLQYTDGYPISCTTVKDWMISYGLKLKGKGGNQRLSELYSVQLRRLPTAGMTAREIAKEVGCSQSYVYILLQRHGLPYKFIIPVGKRKNNR